MAATNHELDILWKHRDQIIDAITDPDALAEEASNVGLIHPETKDVLVSLPVDAKTKVRSLLQSIEGKIKGQRVCFQYFLALLKKLPGLADLGIVLQKTYDEKVTACMVSECGIPRSESADCINGSAVHVTRDANSYMDQDQHSTIATQQEDYGRCGGSCDNVNNASSKKELDEMPKLHQLQRLCSGNIVVNVIKAVAPLWEKFALQLEMDKNMIDIWKRDTGQVEDATRKLFNHWLDGNGRQPISWKTLIQALCETELRIIATNVEKLLTGHSVKRPLDKSAEEIAAKRPCLEGQRNETIGDSSHSANFATDDPLLKHRPKLADFYSRRPEVPGGTWPPVKKTQYINLALIRTEQAIDFNKEFLRQTIRGSIDDIMKDKDDIEYDEVFTEVEEGARLVFEGRPGCGKTTMMNKVSQDWAKWKIFPSSLLCLVHLRKFGNRSDIDLEVVLRSMPVAFADDEFQEMCTQIKVGQGKGIVFALDGLDEYCPDEKEYKSSFVHKLIKRDILPKSTVIVASRPAASQKYRKSATKCIEVLGFLKQQIYEYIDSYFEGDKNKVDGLRTYLEHHPNVMHMCYLPLHMAMVAYLYNIEGASLPQTETEIYYHFTLSTLVRSIKKKRGMELDERFHLKSFKDLSPGDKEIFDLILELAFQATVIEARQVFSHDDVQNFFNKQSSNTGNDEGSLGLVVVDLSFVKYGLEEIYTFLHLTFQEYLAACHIVQLSSQTQEELILKYGGDKKLGVVWKFYCGMTQFPDEQKMHTFEQLFERTKYDLLLQLHCAHESQQDNLCTHVIKSIDSAVILNKKSLNPADFTALGYVLTHSEVPTTELTISSCHIGPEGLSALVKAINTYTLNLKILSFHRTKIREVITEFCSFLTKCPQLCTLVLSGCDIINKVFTVMAEKFPTLESLEHLDLSCNNSGRTSVELLGNMLIKLPNLKSLVWFENLFSPSLFKALKERDIEIFVPDSDNSKSSKLESVRLDSLKSEDVGPVLSYLQAHPGAAVLIQELTYDSISINFRQYSIISPITN